ncbi:FIG007959: peptidase, M16 family [Olavius sp. associated proteobacterium Delta 1]|nr:FIG007959: peptidase, M16 family [Olavius sp. associated proteobacterium Delta 1]
MEKPVGKTTLKNGIRIVTKNMPYARSVSMGVWVNVGARDESALESGLSHFIEHMIFKGTQKRSAFQIAKEFDAIGGNTNAFTTMENTCYYARVIDSHTETMVDILSDIFVNSVFDPGEIDKERPVILQEIGMVEDSPDEYVHMLSGRNFWGKNPLGRSILGTPENLARFDAKTIKNFFHRLYQPDRIIISAAGSIDHSRLVELVEPVFGTIASQDGFPQRQTPPGCSVVDLNHRNLEQLHICLSARGLSITDPRRYACSLLNTILGGNMSSRLFQEVRERRGLAYSVYSFISSHVDTGMFGFYMGVDPRRAQETTRLVLEEIDKIKNEPVESSELSGAMEYTKGSLLLASESADNQMVRSAQNEIHFGDDIALQTIIEKVEAVTADEIQDLANELFNRKQMTLTLLGPVDADKKEFEKILYEPGI